MATRQTGFNAVSIYDAAQFFFCFAEIFEKWIRPPKSGEFIFDTDLDTPLPSQIIETFSIIATSANVMVGAVHERMPVIIPPEDYWRWIDNGRYEGNSVKYLLRPYPAEEMAWYRVSKSVNNAKMISRNVFYRGNFPKIHGQFIKPSKYRFSPAKIGFPRILRDFFV